MRYLLLNSFIVLYLCSCSSAYKSLQPAEQADPCFVKYRPAFTSTLYNTQINILGRHMSGLILFKQMPDSSTRVVFSNEMGFKFFDFEFGKADSFKVHHIMDKMNRKGLIKILRKDFRAVLIKNEEVIANYRNEKGLNYSRVSEGKDFIHYITDSNCSSDSIRAELGNQRKASAWLLMKNYKNGVPDTIGITHRSFKLNIGLKYLDRS